jgi:serine/threonine-protein kinase
MLRSDGVVKLMDFGISHMVDLERLTVTGQLLGSPAYMAPEHVEGRALDFRTDVFAAGIVLYQATVGRLPFEGKNPHEVLKRIAECRFIDPRQANPRIGNRLGRIILRAMAAAPIDRFPAVTEMATALEGYLDETGIAHAKVSSELGRYFQGPAAYEQALKDRMIDHLTRRGQQLVADDDRAAALDVFDRVLTIDPDNPKVLDILAGIHRRKRLRVIAAIAVGAAVLSWSAWRIHRNAQPPDAEPPPAALEAANQPAEPATQPRRAAVAYIELPAPPTIERTPEPRGDPARTIAEPDAGIAAHPAEPAPVSPATAAVATRIRVSPAKDAEYAVASGARKPVPGDGIIRLELTGDAEIHVFSLTKCCQEESKIVSPGADVTIVMPYLPGRVVPLCNDHVTAEVRIGGVSANLGRAFAIPIGDSTDETKPVVVEFLGDHVDPTPIKITASAGKSQEVKCITVR